MNIKTSKPKKQTKNKKSLPKRGGRAATNKAKSGR